MSQELTPDELAGYARIVESIQAAYSAITADYIAGCAKLQKEREAAEQAAYDKYQEDLRAYEATL